MLNTIEDTQKKRGRKPKGAKITSTNSATSSTTLATASSASLTTTTSSSSSMTKQNVIIHLKCSLHDLDNLDNDISSYNMPSFLSFESLENEMENEIVKHPFENVMEIKTKKTTNEKDKDVFHKLKILDYHLHHNNILNKHSCCFWCTFDFETNAVHIPKLVMNDVYDVYGCFCSPECAVGYLFNQNIDSSSKYERYSLLNHLYSNTYGYKQNIKPAPNPFYMLNKFCGILSIEEYRSLSKTDNIFILVDKPITKVLPEFHEDNDEYIITNKIIPVKGSNPKSLIKNKIFNLSGH